MKSAVFLICCVVILMHHVSDANDVVKIEKKPVPAKVSITFPLGTATPSEVCAECHRALYQEHSHGYGSDNVAMAINSSAFRKRGSGPQFAASPRGSAHALAGVDMYPQHARNTEADGKSCNFCHFPQAITLPPLDSDENHTPAPRQKADEVGGLTCASCHLTADGKVRAPYNLRAPHENTPDARIKTAVMCAPCHSLGKRVVGMQSQTYLEWRDDYWKKGLGYNCQNCHMPRTNRSLSENYDVPERVVARHLWTGSRSLQRLQSALTQTVVQSTIDSSKIEIHLYNVGAGHSVPTGSNRRALYLQAEALDANGLSVVKQEWLFAPWYGDRPDDKAFLEEDKKRPDAVAVMQADAQGPHEQVIRAGEERVLTWAPELKPGNYTITTRLMYDLNRYNERTDCKDQTVIGTTKTPIRVAR